MTTKIQTQLSASQQSDTVVSSTGVLQPSLEKTTEFEQDSLQSSITNSTDFKNSAFRENFSRIPVGRGSMPLVQAQLVVGQPNDKYEQEAERVAEQVMRMPQPNGLILQERDPTVQHYKSELDQPLQRQLFESEAMAPEQEEEEEEKTVQAKASSSQPLIRHDLSGANGKVQRQSVENEEEKEEETSVQTKSNVSGQTIVTPTLETQLSSGQGVGHSLPKSTRTLMESRFSQDFSHVRVHTNSPAVQMNRDLNAQAFTHGHHIYFGQGQYQPQTQSGQKLLAHELTHVVQQTGGHKVQTKSLVQLRSLPTVLPRRESPDTSPEAHPARARAAPQPSVPLSIPEIPEPEPVTPKQEERPETERPTSETEESRSVAPAESAAPPAAPTEAGTERADVELLMPEPPSELSAEAQGRLEHAQSQANQATAATSELLSADTNVDAAREAVAEPQEETQARASDALVEALGERPAPSPEIEELCQRIYRIIREQRPPDEEALIEADPEAAAREAGNQLNQSIEEDVQRVEGNYDQLDEPQEGTPEQLPQEIETPPEQVETPEIGATEAVPDPIPAEDVSLDADVNASSTRIEEAGLNTEPARLAAEGAPDGPIASAQSAQDELTETAQRVPAEVLAEQQQALAAASADMATLQETALAALAASRTSTVTGVQSQQTAMVGSEEQMRAQVGQQAQQIFSAAQQQVNTLLAPLQQNAMNKWEQGKTLLTTKFRQSLADVR